MRDLAFRRFQQAKHKRRAWRHLRNNCFSPEERTPRRVGIHAATRKVCSCFMCGNPRRYYRERTLQERRQYRDKGTSVIDVRSLWRGNSY